MNATIAVLGFALAGTGLLSSLAVPHAAAAGTTYYVDCAAGNDGRSGQSAATAWRTVARANKAHLSPGDSLLLKRGCTWLGQLKAHWDGSASQPITIGAYGSGALPVLKNAHDGNVRISGSHQVIENLQTANDPSSYGRIAATCNNQPVGWVVAFNVVGGAYNTVRNVVATQAAIGVAFTSNSHHNRILSSRIVYNTGAWDLPANGHIRGGTGVVLEGDANELGWNHFEGNTTKCGNESIAVELYTATNSNVHHNTVYSDKVFTELGSTSKIRSANNSFAYNVHATNKGNARFLVTRGYGTSFGPVTQTKVFNNVVYYDGPNSAGVVCMSCGQDILTLQNNIIVAATKALFVGAGQSLNESHNIYWAPNGAVPKWNFVQNWPMNGASRLADPRFVNPGAKDFHLKSGSPAINAGSNAALNAGYNLDLDAGAVPAGGAVDIGAYEFSSSSGAKQPQQEGATGDNASGRITIPGRIEAEDYNAGGQGVGYSDTTPANLGTAYRTDGVDIQPCSDQSTPAGETCYNVGWPAPGEWLAYDVKVATSGTYKVAARVASNQGGTHFHLEVDGKNVSGSVAVPNTGTWQTWTTITLNPVTLAAGNHTFKLVSETASYNVNYLEVTS